MDRLLWWLRLEWRFLMSRLRKMPARARGFVFPRIHTPDDGRGGRDVYLDGTMIERVVYADTRRGFVRMHHEPMRVSRRRDCVITKEAYGEVKVVQRG